MQTRIYVGTNGVDDFSVPSREIRFDGIFVGRHTEAKGIFDLFAAWRLVCDTRPEARLVCVGSITPDDAAKCGRSAFARLGKERYASRPCRRAREVGSVRVVEVLRLSQPRRGMGYRSDRGAFGGAAGCALTICSAYAGTIAKSPGALLVSGDVASLRSLAARSSFFGERAVDALALKNWAKRFTWSAAAAREELILQEALADSESVAWIGGMEALRYYETGGAKGRAPVVTILDALSKKANLGRTLDIGCGNGAVLEALSAYTPDVFGVDVSAKRWFRRASVCPRRPCFSFDVQESLPFADSVFDSVLMLDVIEHSKAPGRSGGDPAQPRSGGLWRSRRQTQHRRCATRAARNGLESPTRDTCRCTPRLHCRTRSNEPVFR